MHSLSAEQRAMYPSCNDTQLTELLLLQAIYHTWTSQLLTSMEQIQTNRKHL